MTTPCSYNNFISGLLPPPFFSPMLFQHFKILTYKVHHRIYLLDACKKEREMHAKNRKNAKAPLQNHINDIKLCL